MRLCVGLQADGKERRNQKNFLGFSANRHSADNLSHSPYSIHKPCIYGKAQVNVRFTTLRKNIKLS